MRRPATNAARMQEQDDGVTVSREQAAALSALLAAARRHGEGELAETRSSVSA